MQAYLPNIFHKIYFIGLVWTNLNQFDIVVREFVAGRGNAAVLMGRSVCHESASAGRQRRGRAIRAHLSACGSAMCRDDLIDVLSRTSRR